MPVFWTIRPAPPNARLGSAGRPSRFGHGVKSSRPNNPKCKRLGADTVIINGHTRLGFSIDVGTPRRLEPLFFQVALQKSECGTFVPAARLVHDHSQF